MCTWWPCHVQSEAHRGIRNTKYVQRHRRIRRQVKIRVQGIENYEIGASSDEERDEEEEKSDDDEQDGSVGSTSDMDDDEAHNKSVGDSE